MKKTTCKSKSKKKCAAAELAKATIRVKNKKLKRTPLGATTCKKAGHDLRIHGTSTAGRKLRTC